MVAKIHGHQKQAAHFTLAQMSYTGQNTMRVNNASHQSLHLTPAVTDDWEGSTFNRVWLISAPGGNCCHPLPSRVLTLGHKEKGEIKCCGGIIYGLILPSFLFLQGPLVPVFFFFFLNLQVEDLQWFAHSLTLSSIFLKYRREAEDNLRVPPRGADKDKDHQFHSRGDDAFTQ